MHYDARVQRMDNEFVGWLVHLFHEKGLEAVSHHEEREREKQIGVPRDNAS